MSLRRHEPSRQGEHDTYCSVGVSPLPLVMATGVAAGVAGVTPGPGRACDACGGPVGRGRLLDRAAVFWRGQLHVAAGEGQRAGAVKALACAAVAGWVWMASMFAGDMVFMVAVAVEADTPELDRSARSHSVRSMLDACQGRGGHGDGEKAGGLKQRRAETRRRAGQETETRRGVSSPFLG